LSSEVNEKNGHIHFKVYEKDRKEKRGIRNSRRDAAKEKEGGD